MHRSYALQHAKVILSRRGQGASVDVEYTVNAKILGKGAIMA